MTDERKKRIMSAYNQFIEKNDPNEIDIRRRARSKKPKKEREYPLERDEQRALVAVLLLNGVYFMHPPNEGKRSVWEGRRLFETQGGLKGAADLYIFDRLPAFPEARGLAIELKRVKGSSPPWGREEQQEHLYQLSALGWKCFVAQGHRAGVAILQKCGLVEGIPAAEQEEHIKEFSHG